MASQPNAEADVLIVEDSPPSRSALRRDLAACGFARLREAADAASADDEVRRAAPDLILLDLGLPDREGQDLLRAWRADEALAAVPVIVVSAAGGDAPIRQSLAAGADDFLRKPWSAVELCARIQTHLARRRAETRLRRVETTFNAVQEMANMGAWEWNVETGELHWTERVREIIGLAPDETPDVETTLSRFPPEMEKRIRGFLGQAVRDGSPFEFESPFTTLDGDHIWVRGTGRALRRDGRTLTLWGAFQDVTEEVEIRQALQENQERLHLALEAASDGVWDWRVQSDELYLSPRWYGMLGYAPDELPASMETWRGLVHPEDAQEVWRRLDEHLATGAPFEVEYRMRAKGGGWMWVLSRGKVVERDTGGQALRMLGTNADIGPRKAAEEERDRLFDLSVDMLCVAGFDGRFRQINPAWSRTLGWDDAELLARPFLDFVHPDDRQPTIDAMSRLSEGETVVGFENRYRCKDGAYRWISWNTFPVPEREIVFAVARDVTTDKEYQDRLAYDASHDLLTDLYNRGYLLDELVHQVASARRYGHPLAFCLGDIDHFKAVNDTHGHQIGDAVLARFAGVLKACARDADLVGRYGGEEFALVLPCTDAEGGRRLAERALEELRATSFRAEGGETFHITATFGVAHLGAGMTDSEALIAAADRALYDGKRAGRDRVVVA